MNVQRDLTENSEENNYNLEQLFGIIVNFIFPMIFDKKTYIAEQFQHSP